MNITKTNMLLLDNNKIRKDDADNTTVAAPVPSTTEPKTGINALMFQGMQNLMANPALAKEVGVMNDDTAANSVAKSYVAPFSSNVAFKGGKFANAFKTLAVSSAVALAAATLTSCNDKEYISVPATEDITNVEVNVTVDTSAMTALIGMMQSTLTQMLLQQQLSYEQFQKYMEKMDAWQKQVDQRMANLELILTNMADNIFDIKNNVKQGFDENNAYQAMIVGMLEQFMTRDEAIALFNKLFAEVAAGNKTVSQALAEIMKELKLVNQNLDTIIANQDRAYEQQKQVLTTLSMIEGNTAEARDIAKAQYQQLKTINNTIVDGNNKVVSSINHLDGDMKYGFAATAQAIGWQTYQLGDYINKGVMSIIANNNWNASMVKAAIDYNTQITKEGNDLAAEYYAKFEAGMITAEELANKLIEIAEDIDSKMDTLIANFNNYANNMQKAAAIAINELRYGNYTATQTKELVKDVIANQQKAYAMLEIMNQNIEKMDDDVVKGNQQVVAMLKWLGYTEAQISAMSTAAIRDAIRNAGNKIIATLGDQLDTIIENMSNDPNTSNAFYLQQVVALLEQVAADVSEIKGSVADLNAKLDALLAKVENIRKYAKANYYENKYQSGVVTYIAGELTKVGNDIADIKTTEEAILEKLENGDSLTAEEMEIIIARLGNGIHQDLSGVKALLQADVAQNGILINLVAKVSNQLKGLGSISQQILNEIANLGDDLEGLQGISDKLDELIAAVNNLSAKFDQYAKSALNAHAQEIELLKNVQANSDKIVDQNQTLINQVKKANIQLTQIDNDINSLKNLIKNLEGKLGRSITPEELDEILSKHDAANQEFYANLISKTTLNPKDYTTALEYLTKLGEILVTGQKLTNDQLAELIELVKKYPQYKDQIIEAINKIKVEVTCQCDCDDNTGVHEGVIQIIS